MRASYGVFSIFLASVIAPVDAVSQSESSPPGYSSAMHPKLSTTVRDYLAALPLQESEASKYAIGDPFFTYVGGDTTEIGIAAHQFPNGSVVLGIQTLSPGLPVTENAPRKELSGVGADWYIVHFDPATGQTFFASYYGTDEHDWLSDMECEDSTFRCIFAGASQGVALGKTAGPHDLFIAIMGFIDPITLEAAYQIFCTLFGLEPGDWFSNAAFWIFLSATAESETSAKYDPSGIQLGAGICGFRTIEGRINGLIAIVDPGSCQVENVLESTFMTDDTFFDCYSDTGLDGTPVPVVSGVGMRDNDANLAIGEPSTPTLCYAHQNETTMTCNDMPAADPLGPAGKTVARAANDQYQDIERDPDLGTFALGWNSTSGFGFIDYWASTDLSVVGSTAPLRVSTDFGQPLAMSLSNMGRVSFTNDWVSSDTYYGQRIGTYAVTSDASAGKRSNLDVGRLAFLNWTALPGVNRAAITLDVDDYPFRRGYTGASWLGIETSATAIQSECPNGLRAPCASFGEVDPGLNYVSACNLTAESVSLDFATSSPGVETESGFFFDITDTGSIEPSTCSRLYGWPAKGGFNLDLTPTSGSPAKIGSLNDGLSGPFSTIILNDAVHTVEVNDDPTTPRTFAVYFTNTLNERVNMTVYGSDGDLYTASLDPLAASVFNVLPVDLGSTVYIAGSTDSGLEDVFALDLPTTDFVWQSLIVSGASGKNQNQALDILVFNAMGVQADTRVVTSVESAAELPETYALHANYPNPFNPTTQITFDLSEQSSAELEIVNVFGQRVRAWSYENSAAGRYTVTWDGRDSDGALVASGVYLYRLSTQHFEETRKMTLLR